MHVWLKSHRANEGTQWEEHHRATVDQTTCVAVSIKQIITKTLLHIKTFPCSTDLHQHQDQGGRGICEEREPKTKHRAGWWGGDW